MGEGVDGWAVGARVCVLPFARCGDCALCLSGNEQVCLQAVPHGVGLGTGRLGLTTITLEELRSTDAPACVFDCAGSPSSAQLGVELLGPLGQLMLVGLSLAPLDLPAPAIVIKELDVRGVIAYRRSESRRRSICWPPEGSRSTS